DTHNICEMTFKNHACCGHTFAPIDGALELQRRHNIRSQDIARVSISTYGPALAVAGNPNPSTAAEARFSIPFVVATALLHGSVRLDRKSTRLNSSHVKISYAVFCLKKKK